MLELCRSRFTLRIVNGNAVESKQGQLCQTNIIPTRITSTSTAPGGHDRKHVHGPGCGHEAVPHGDHTDYLVDGRLHHPHGDHCDDHGPVEVVKN